MIFGKLGSIILALVFFGILITVHEGGHFLAARACGVKVNEFSIGMGPAILKKQGKETLYSLRILPIGGYCAMEGEQENSEDPKSFNNKHPYQKGIILLAGATMNILVGVLLMAIMLGSSDLIGTNSIRMFADDATTKAAGLQEGDKITCINNHRIYTQYDVSYYLMTDKDALVNFTVERDGESLYFSDVPLQKVTAEDGNTYVAYDFAVVGVEPTFLNTVKYSVMDSVSIVRMVWSSLIGMVSGDYSLDDLSGPIGTVDLMADTTSDAVSSHDYSTLLYLLALIALNLGAFILIPFPALDGGQFVFVMVEGIIRKPVPDSIKAAANSIGFMLLMGFMLLVTFSDIFKLF